MQNLTPVSKGEVAIYQPDNSIHLEVLTDQETVWLTQAQMVMLFNRDKSVISRHIRNIFDESELEKEATVAYFATVQNEKGRQVERLLEYYNLDLIISIGYRVKSKQGILFRQWATRVLKEYIIKGYAINQRLERIEERISNTEHQINFFVKTALPPVEGIFYDGQVFDAYAFVSDLIKSAKKSIILIDNYVDESVLLLLSKRKKNVSAKILTANFNQSLKQDLSKYNAQYSPIKIEKFTKSHDRFLIIDDTQIYHIGASLKDLGKKWFAFSKMKQLPLS
ncbi:MAG: virulence RhuM family protein [Bacteroidales bacterium]|nr:virulence RhuM family protein [Bacteroidales bacterium]